MKKSDINEFMLFKLKNYGLCALLSRKMNYEKNINYVFVNKESLFDYELSGKIHLDWFKDNLSCTLKENGISSDIIAIKQFKSIKEVLYYVLNDKEPEVWDWSREEKLVPIYHRKDIEIKDGIGYFEDEFIDVINVQIGDKVYEIVPIGGKFAVPYVKSGIVDCVYKKYEKRNVVNVNSGSFLF